MTNKTLEEKYLEEKSKLQKDLFDGTKLFEFVELSNEVFKHQERDTTFNKVSFNNCYFTFDGFYKSKFHSCTFNNCKIFYQAIDEFLIYDFFSSANKFRECEFRDCWFIDEEISDKPAYYTVFLENLFINNHLLKHENTRTNKTRKPQANNFS